MLPMIKKNILPSPNNTSDTPLSIDDRPIRRIGFIIVLITFGIFGGWAFFAPIDSSALAPGSVTVKSHRKTVQHLDGGIIAKILVKDGDIVKQDQPLIILDDIQLKAELEITRGKLITFLAQEARLIAERDELNKIVYPKDLSDNSDPRIQEAKNTESHLFLSRRNTYQGEISVLKQQIGQLDSKIQGSRGQINSKKELTRSYSEEIKDLSELLAEGFADKQRLRDLERNRSLATGEIAELSADIAASQMQQSEIRLKILQIQKQFQEEVATKLSEVQSDLYDARERLTAVQDKLNRIEIKAPEAGQVLGLSIHTEGGVITAGKPILDIVPQNAELVIDAQVSPLDIDRVSTGLVAEVRFTSFKRLTPVLHGKVIDVSADSFKDEKTGNSFYQAKVELTSESKQKLGQLQIVPGMPAEVLINTGERTLFEYLIQPVTDSLARALIED